MKHYYSVRTNGIVLLPFSAEDLEKQRLLRNSQKDYFIDNNVISPEQQAQWYESYLKKENDFMFKITNDENCFLGSISLYNVNIFLKTTEFGRICVKDNAPRYTGTKAIKALIDFANLEFNTRIIICSVRTDNLRAIYIYQKIGFREFGRDGFLIFMEYVF